MRLVVVGRRRRRRFAGARGVCYLLHSTFGVFPSPVPPPLHGVACACMLKRSACIYRVCAILAGVSSECAGFRWEAAPGRYILEGGASVAAKAGRPAMGRISAFSFGAWGRPHEFSQGIGARGQSWPNIGRFRPKRPIPERFRRMWASAWATLWRTHPRTPFQVWASFAANARGRSR